MNLTRHLLAAITLSLLVFAGTAFAQTSTLSTEVKGPDGRPATNAEVRLDRADRKAAPVIRRTDAKGKLTVANLPVGKYLLTVTSAQGARSSQLVTTTANKQMLVTFDLQHPMAKNGAPAKKKIYVYRDSPTGTHMLGHWEEVGAPEQVDDHGRPVDTISGETLQRMSQAPRLTPPGN